MVDDGITMRGRFPPVAAFQGIIPEFSILCLEYNLDSAS